MKLNQAFQFKLKANKEQEEKLKTYSGACRFVWNKTLNLVKNRLVEYNTYKIVNALPQGLREVTPVKYAMHTLKQEPAGSRKALPLPEAV